MRELRLMKGNEALAEAAIRSGCDAYFGYPITPQSEVIEYLMREKPYEKTGMVVLQAESEIAAINMIYGAGGAGKKAMTSSSSPGISLMQEGVSYLAGAEIPCLLVNINRGGPGLGTIQPSQGDYFQSVKGGGHGDYHLIVLAPASVQEMADFVNLGWELAFKYRMGVMILSDGAIGQMMEKVELDEQKPRSTVIPGWATVGKPTSRERNFLTSLYIQPEEMYEVNKKLAAKYKEVEKNEIRVEKMLCEECDYLIVGYGLSARISQKAAQLAKEKGKKVGVIRPITLWPFPYDYIDKVSDKVKGILVVEMNMGQMIEDVKLAVHGKVPVEFFGRQGGIIPTPEEVLHALETQIIGG
jgi:2-oxoglutarate/2-oxoacid ferredoxin oxidoreductase subunit alpha